MGVILLPEELQNASHDFATELAKATGHLVVVGPRELLGLIKYTHEDDPLIRDYLEEAATP
jgi:hypothetical protein